MTHYPAAWQVEYRAYTLTGLGRAAYGLGNQAEAQQHLYQALQMTVEIQAFIPLIHLIPVISVVLANEAEVDQKERAIALYVLASSHPFVANSCLFADIAGRHIAAVAATLPPELSQQSNVAAGRLSGEPRRRIVGRVTEVGMEWVR